jgi:hypothetical protein
VSCTSATACTAVGAFQSMTGVWMTLAERWNGSRWAIESTPDPRGGGELFGVSCTLATACTAVGTAPGGTLAERWNGTAWAIDETPNPRGADTNCGYELPTPGFASGCVGLLGVSCTSATACVAVGYSYARNIGLGPLAEAWNGSTWALQDTGPIAGPIHSSGQLNAVSCTSQIACTAVGATQGLPVAAAWDGTSWSSQTTSMEPPGAVAPLTGVSCPTPTACTAVGGGVAGGVTVQAWNGSNWSLQTTPSVDFGSGSLDAVSCPTAISCTAVGGDPGGGATVLLAETWDGMQWALDTVADPPSAPGPALEGKLSSISCSAATTCVAVGAINFDSGLASSEAPLVEFGS